MKILAVDTATQSCSVAIIDTGSLSAELTTVNDQTHSKHLMDLIHAVLRLAGFRIGDMGGFAVTLGPGSFTGLRIGISTVKGLAQALDKPVVGISSLDTLAWQCTDRTYLICPLLDARKGEVYFATYRLDNDRLIPKSTERVKPPEKAVQDIKEPCVFVGNGAQLYRKDIKAALGNMAYFALGGQNIIRASSVAFLSVDRFETHNTDEVASLVPHYIRKSDAELNF